MKLATIITILLFFYGCSDEQSPDVSTRSHFLASCDSDSDCPNPLACYCGSCQKPCESVQNCDFLNGDGICAMNDSSICASAETALCQQQCQVASDCGLHAYCFDNHCISLATAFDEQSCQTDEDCVLAAFYRDDGLGCEDTNECVLAAFNQQSSHKRLAQIQKGCEEVVSHESCSGTQTAYCIANECTTRDSQSNSLCGEVVVYSNTPGLWLEIAPIQCEVSAGNNAIIEYKVMNLTGESQMELSIDAGRCPSQAEPQFTVSNSNERYCYDCAVASDTVCDRDVSVYALDGSVGYVEWDGRTGGDSWPASLRRAMPTGSYAAVLSLSGHLSNGDEVKLVAYFHLVIANP